MPYPPERLSRATSRGQTMPPEGQRPAQCPDRGQSHSDMDVQPLENTALLRGIIHKSACILAEITIRKSQCSAADLETYWREAFHLPYTSPSRKPHSRTATLETRGELAPILATPFPGRCPH